VRENNRIQQTSKRGRKEGPIVTRKEKRKRNQVPIETPFRNILKRIDKNETRKGYGSQRSLQLG
jgi:hypothetical protein